MRFIRQLGRHGRGSLLLSRQPRGTLDFQKQQRCKSGAEIRKNAEEATGVRFPNYNPRLSIAENRRLAEDYLRQSGTEQKPRPPRGLIAQPASRGFLVSWSLPEGSRNKEIVSWRIYKDNENALYKEIADRGNRQIFIESTGGNSPPKVAAFISSMNAYGRESSNSDRQQRRSRGWGNRAS